MTPARLLLMTHFVATWFFLVATGLVLPRVSMPRQGISVLLQSLPKGRIFLS